MRIDSIILTEGSDIINLTVASGPTFPSNPSTSELFYKTTSAVGLYYYDGATWNRIGSSDELVAHATSSSLHLTSTQNAFLDAITVSSAEVNFLSGVTADIQGQLNDKLARDGDTINNTTIGATLAASGRFTTAKFNGTTYNPYVVAFGPGSHVGWTDPTDTGIGPYMASDGSDWRLIAGGSERLKITSGGAGIFTGPMEISGALTLGGPPTANLHAATKQYVDDGLAGVSGSVTLTGDVTGSGTGTIITTLTNTGVTASTYKSVTVDAKGRVTAGTNPTTLNGFGITDAVSTNATSITLGGLYTTFTANAFLSNADLVSGKKVLLTLPAADFNGVVTILSIRGVGDSSASSTTRCTYKVTRTGAVTGAFSLFYVESLDNLDGASPFYHTWFFDNTTGIPYLRFSQAANSHSWQVVTELSITTLPTLALDSGTSPPGVTVNPMVETNTINRTGYSISTAGTERLRIVGSAADLTGNLNISGTITASNYIGAGTGLTGTATSLSIGGNAATASTLQTSRNIGITGDVSGSANFNGSTNISISSTLTNTGVTASTYKSVTVDAKGRVTAGTNPTTLNGFGITDGVQNAGTVPSVSSGVFSGRPTAGTTGRIYYSADTFATYRDNGSTWDLMIPALSGDINMSAGSTSTALSTTGVTAGTYNSVTVDTKGRVTAATNVAANGNPNYLINNQVGYLATGSMAASSFSVASGHRAIVRSIHVTNISAASVNLAAEIRYGGTTSVSIAANMPIPAGTAVELFERPHVLNPSDQLRFQAGSSNALHVTITWEDNTTTAYFGTGAALTTTSMTDIYTSTSITSAVESVLLVNYDTNVNNDTVTVVWTDGSNNIQGYLCYDMVVPVGGTIELLQNPKFLTSGYKIRASTPVANRVAVHVAGKTL